LALFIPCTNVTAAAQNTLAPFFEFFFCRLTKSTALNTTLQTEKRRKHKKYNQKQKKTQ